MTGSPPVVGTNAVNVSAPTSGATTSAPQPELPPVPPTIKPTPSVKVPSASEILEKCRGYGLGESAQLILDAREHLIACRDQESIAGTSLQISDLVLLPQRGVAYLMSDIEGRADCIAALIDKERLIERWQKNDPDDQPYLCILGDMIDRSSTSSLLVELLLELKCRHGFSRQIIILPGNHELTPSVQMYGAQGFFQELVNYRNSFRETDDVKAPAVQEVIRLCSERGYFGKFGWEDTPPSRASDQLHQTRRAVWLMYNEIFNLLPKSISSTNGLFASHAGFPVHGAFDQSPQEQPSRPPTLLDLALLSPSHTDGVRSFHPDLAFEDLTWSDLQPELDGPSSPTKLGPNFNRGDVGVAFSHAAFATFAAVGEYSLFIRGHQGNPPPHPEVVPIEPGTWVYRNIVTICNGMVGGYAKLDLSIHSPTPGDVTLDYVDVTPPPTEELLEGGFILGPDVDLA